MPAAAAPAITRAPAALLRPRALRAGDRIFVWAPSSPAPAVYPRRFQRGVDALTRAGFEVVVGTTCRTAGERSPLPPALVADELHEALSDERCDGVVAAVGGWTLLPVLRELDFELIASMRKPIVGYSDLTGLLNVVALKEGLITFHGPMVVSEWGESGGPWEYTAHAFLRMLGGSWKELVVEQAEAWSDELLWWDREDHRPRRANSPGEGEVLRVLNHGRGEGALWGGSLVALGLLAGTEFWVTPERGILCIEAEEIAPDEFWARLTQLALAGAFDGAAGVVVGKIGRPRATLTGSSNFDDVIRDAVSADVPILAGLDIGHTEPMCSLPIGARGRLTCSESGGELRILGPVVESDGQETSRPASDTVFQRERPW